MNCCEQPTKFSKYIFVVTPNVPKGRTSSAFKMHQVPIKSAMRTELIYKSIDMSEI